MNCAAWLQHMGRAASAAATLAVLLSAAGTAPAQTLQKSTVRHGSVEVPVEIALPAGRGPWPPVLYIHAKRGYEDVDREHIRALARDGFLVLAPDWLAANMIERWPDRHVPESEDDVAAALTALRAHPQACRQPVGIVAKSRGPYFAIRLAAARPLEVGPIVAYYGHFQHPNAPEPQQLFSTAPEVQQIRSPVLMLIGDADFELRRMVNGRAFYALWERGVPVELQMYPMARRAFDFRADQSPEEKIAARHAAQREREWLKRWMGVDASGRCAGPPAVPGR
jgi:carboxymethylenebutenolidase